MDAVRYEIVLESFPGSEFMSGAPKSEEKKPKETHEQFEERTWKQKIHVNAKGEAVLNRFALKNALEAAAGRLRMPVPGKTKSEYKARFIQGIVPFDAPVIRTMNGTAIKPDDFEARRLFVPAGGKRGDGTRVYRIFPTLTSWTTTVTLLVLDHLIDEKVLMEHLNEAGIFIGLGSMRVAGGGINGRFLVKSIKTLS